MELLAVRFETDCKDEAILAPVARKFRSREIRKAEVSKGAIGFDLTVHVRPGASEGATRGAVARMLPPGVLISRTFASMGEPPEQDDDDTMAEGAPQTAQGS
jgi:hypothetical protein